MESKHVKKAWNHSRRQHQEDQIQITRTYKYLFSFKEIHILSFFLLPFVMQSFLSLHCYYCSHFCSESCCFFCITAELSYCFNAIFIVSLMKTSSFVRLFVNFSLCVSLSFSHSLARFALIVLGCQLNLPLERRQYNCNILSGINLFLFMFYMLHSITHSITNSRQAYKIIRLLRCYLMNQA